MRLEVRAKAAKMRRIPDPEGVTIQGGGLEVAWSPVTYKTRNRSNERRLFAVSHGKALAHESGAEEAPKGLCTPVRSSGYHV